ncbi:hypothetical protein GGF50DRAFT_88623 [Schizophyllum commune]
MGIFYEEMPDWLMTWIAKQHLFFVATAPKEGHVNMSPKGVDGTFHVIDSHTIWYEDMSGSGVETIAHLRDTNGRITIMFVAFDRPPRVVRLYGTGTIHEYGTPEYDKYIPAGKRHPGSRAVIEVDIHKVGASCGYGVPFYNYAGPRTLLSRKTAKFEADIKPDGDNFMRKYWREHLMKSIDGLPALQVAPETASTLVNIGVLEEEWDTKKSKIQMGLERYGIDAKSFLAGSILTALMMLVVDAFCGWLLKPPSPSSNLSNMGSFYDEMPDWLMAWIAKQHLFFVATAPKDGHVNVSPKGVEGTFHVVDPHTVWYEDLTGSGIETISHLRDNGRITIMFMAIDKPPRICRLFGTSAVHEFGTPEYEKYIPANKRRPGSRAVIEINIHKVGASCGYGVPFFTYAGPRTLLERVSVKFEADVKDDGESYLRKYWREHSLKSLDGLPALQVAPEVNKPLVNVGVLQEEWAAGDQSDKVYRIAAALSSYGIDAKSFLAGTVSAMLFMVALMRFVEGR